MVFDGQGMYSLSMVKGEDDKVVAEPTEPNRKRHLVWMHGYSPDVALSLTFKNMTGLSIDGLKEGGAPFNGGGAWLFGLESSIAVEQISGDVYLGGLTDASALSVQSSKNAAIRITDIGGKLSLVDNTKKNMFNYATGLLAWAHDKEGNAMIELSNIRGGIDISRNTGDGVGAVTVVSQFGAGSISIHHISGGMIVDGNDGYYGPLNAVGKTMGSIQIENISGDLVFSNNTGQRGSYGGVVTLAGEEAETILSIRNVEGNVSMLNNSAFEGGAIYFQGTSNSGGFFTLSDIQGDVLFSGNRAESAGGAIISSGNSESGSAFVVMTLSADGGDIVFEKNTANGQASAIYAEGRHQIALRAAEGKTLAFYDPLTLSEGMDSVMDINKSVADREYAGTVVFSGAKVDREDIANLQSIIDAEINVHEGTLSIEDQAIVKANSLTQYDGNIQLSNGGVFYATNGINQLGGRTAIGTNSVLEVGNYSQSGGLLVLSAGSTLTSSGNVSLSNLVLDLNSSQGDIAAINANQGTLRIDGAIAVQSSSASGVSPILQIHASNIEGRLASPDSDKSVVVANNGLKREIRIAWDSVTTDEETGVSSLTLYSSESILGIVSEMYGSNVANSMLSSASNVEGFSQNALGHINPMRFQTEKGTSLWTSGLGDFSFHRSQDGLDGYDYQGGGYSLGADHLFNKEWLLGMAYGQIFGKNKSRNYHSDINQTSLMGMIYGAWLKKLNEKNALVFASSFAYGNTDNDLTSVYAEGRRSSGKWDNNAFIYNFKAMWNMSLDGGYTLSPYIGLEYTDVSQDSFTESGEQTRHFGKGHYRNLALPVGVEISRSFTLGNGMQWYNAVNVSYVADAYRHNTETSAVVDGYGWKAQGIKAARNAVRANVASNLRLSDQWSTFCSYTFEGRSDASSHQVNIGAAYSF